MDSVIALDIGKEAIWVLLKVALPLMIVALVVGLAISLIQALTQIQEMTLSFVPKIIAIFVALAIFLPFMGNEMGEFYQELANRMVQKAPEE